MHRTQIVIDAKENHRDTIGSLVRKHGMEQGPVAPRDLGAETLLLGCYAQRCTPTIECGSPRTLASIWRAVVAGEFRVARALEETGRFGLVLAKSTTPKALGARQMQLLGRALVSPAQKCLVYEDDRSASTIATGFSHALALIGVGGIASRVPFFMVVAARAAQFSASSVRGPGNDNALTSSSEVSVTLHAPDAWLGSRLTEAEREVTRLRLYGHGHAEIAGRRRTSLRTVANQLGASYRKLRVSGRAQLMILVADEYLAGNVPMQVDRLASVDVAERGCTAM